MLKLDVTKTAYLERAEQTIWLFSKYLIHYRLTFLEREPQPPKTQKCLWLIKFLSTLQMKFVN